MRYIIIYDISDDNIRSLVAKKLEDYGLTRIQFSSFIGKLPRFKLSSLCYELNEVINNAKDSERRSIIIYPLCDSCYSKGIAIDPNMKESKDDDIIVI
ncbi:MAG: CRISPR-associated protein Cas2 [Candidatus Nitrosocaldaceae archaeon]|nr:MAG: CRISPR-associated protein Cas2 [Candidatus Nitrosocaldaceae archaeon]